MAVPQQKDIQMGSMRSIGDAVIVHQVAGLGDGRECIDAEKRDGVSAGKARESNPSAPTAGTTRVIIVGGEVMLRDSLLTSLRVAGFEKPAAVETVEQIPSTADTTTVDVVLLNARRGLHELEGDLMVIRECVPQSEIVLLSSEYSEEDLLYAALHDVHGMMTYTTPIPHLAAVLHGVAEGAYMVASQPTKLLLRSLKAKNAVELKCSCVAKGDGQTTEGCLSEREREVLRLVAQGLESKEIGTQLYISHNTVRNHVSSIMSKLDVHSRAGAVGKALTLGYIDSEQGGSLDQSPIEAPTESG